MVDQPRVFHPPYRLEASEHGSVTIYDAVDVGWIARVKESLPHKEQLAAAMVDGLNAAAMDDRGVCPENMRCIECGADLRPTPEQIEALERFGNPLRRPPCLKTVSGLHRVAAANECDPAMCAEEECTRFGCIRELDSPC